MKNHLLLVVAIIFFHSNLFSQKQTYSNVDFTIVAEGNDSPFKDLQVVCYNKYFNLEQLPMDFQEKYNLTDRQLYKQKMLVQIFFSDTEKQGLDKIEIAEVKESSSEIIFSYNIVNSDSTNDSTVQSPFIVIQIPKSRKVIKFIANGKELGKGQELYIQN